MTMAFELPKLAYSADALASHISAETLEFHHGKHHAAYVNNLNNLITGGKFESAALEEIIKGAGAGSLFDNAGQYFNHCFYWNCMKPRGGGNPGASSPTPSRRLLATSRRSRRNSPTRPPTHFGSGWAWLVQKADGSLEVFATHDGDNPVAHGSKPLMTCDVWEHAYYIDYRNARARYVEAWWNLVNWDFAAANLQ